MASVAHAARSVSMFNPSPPGAALSEISRCEVAGKHTNTTRPRLECTGRGGGRPKTFMHKESG